MDGVRAADAHAGKVHIAAACVCMHTRTIAGERRSPIAVVHSTHTQQMLAGMAQL